MRFKMIGFGKLQYLARTGQSVDWLAVGVALQKNYISVYLSVMRDGTSPIEPYTGRLGESRAGHNNFSFEKYEDLDVRALASLFAEVEQIFHSYPRRCTLGHGGTKSLRTPLIDTVEVPWLR